MRGLAEEVGSEDEEDHEEGEGKEADFQPLLELAAEHNGPKAPTRKTSRIVIVVVAMMVMMMFRHAEWMIISEWNRGGRRGR